MLVGQNASTMEIAKALNVSQMTAWKLRDAIIKGVPLSYRSKRDIQTRQQITRHSDVVSGCGVNSAIYEEVIKDQHKKLAQIENEKQQPFIIEQQQQQQQQQLQQQQHKQQSHFLENKKIMISKRSFQI